MSKFIVEIVASKPRVPRRNAEYETFDFIEESDSPHDAWKSAKSKLPLGYSLFTSEVYRLLRVSRVEHHVDPQDLEVVYPHGYIPQTGLDESGSFRLPGLMG